MPVALVEEHDPVRQGMELVLHSAGHYEVVVHARQGDELLRALSDGAEVHVVVLDAARAERDGCAAVKQVRDRWPALRLLAMIPELTTEAVRQCCQQGAHAVLAKDCSGRDFLMAMDRLRRGEHHRDDSPARGDRTARGDEPPAQQP